MVIEPVYHTLGKKLEPEQPQQRRYILSSGVCVTCSQHKAYEMMPPHDASGQSAPRISRFSIQVLMPSFQMIA